MKAECSQRIDAIDAAMPTLILAAKDGAGNDLSVVTVSMDGAPLASTLDGRPVAIDPGEHAFRFEAAGSAAPREEARAARRREGPPRERRPRPAASAAVGRRAAAGDAASRAERVELAQDAGHRERRARCRRRGARRRVRGVSRPRAQSREKSDCAPSACPNRPQAVADYDTATKDATGSTVAFAAGGVLLAAGVVLWLTAPSDASPPTTAATASASARGVRFVPGFTANGGRVAFEGSF